MMKHRLNLAIGLTLIVTFFVLVPATRASVTNNSLFNNTGFNPAEVALKEQLLYKRLIDYHIPYGQPWTIQWKAQGDYHKRNKCECNPNGPFTTQTPYCGNVVSGSSLLVNDPTYTGNPVETYGDDGDGAEFTGRLLAMLAYKLAVSQESAVFEQLKSALTTLETMYALHSRRGLFARSFVPPSAVFQLDPGDGSIEVDTDPRSPYYGYKFRTGDMTRDQYSGIMWGLYTAYKLVDDESIRSRLRYLVTEFVEALINNGYVLQDKQIPIDFSIGLIGYDQANMVLAYLHMAYEMTGDSRYKDEYESKVTANSPLDVTALYMAKQLSTNLSKGDAFRCYFKTNYYQFTIVSPALFINAGLSYGTSLESDFGGILSQFYNGVSTIGYNYIGLKDEKNVLFDIIYAIGMNGGEYHYWLPDSYKTLDQDAVNSALTQLALYPEGPRYRAEYLNNLEPSDKLLCGDNITDIAINMDRRPPTVYAWQDTPHRMDSGCVQPWVEYSALDFLETYWMARYFGFFLQPQVEVKDVELGSGNDPSVRFRVALKGWIPHDKWSIDKLYITLYDEDGTALETQTVSLSTPLSWQDPNYTLTWEPEWNTPIRFSIDNTVKYRLHISKSILVPWKQYPNNHTLTIEKNVVFYL